MKMSDMIADFIDNLISDNGGIVQLQRRSLANHFSCVPSQINYVIDTRFTPKQGYFVESQRGGGGFIRIIRLMDDKSHTLLETARGIGGRMTQSQAAKFIRTLVCASLLEVGEGKLLLSACSDGALAEVPEVNRNLVRAAIIRCGIMGIAS